MFCNKCGKEVPDGSVYCNHCGATLPVIDNKGGVSRNKTVRTTTDTNGNSPSKSTKRDKKYAPNNILIWLIGIFLNIYIALCPLLNWTVYGKDKETSTIFGITDLAYFYGFGEHVFGKEHRVFLIAAMIGIVLSGTIMVIILLTRRGGRIVRRLFTIIPIILAAFSCYIVLTFGGDGDSIHITMIANASIAIMILNALLSLMTLYDAERIILEGNEADNQFKSYHSPYKEANTIMQKQQVKRLGDVLSHSYENRDHNTLTEREQTEISMATSVLSIAQKCSNTVTKQPGPDQETMVLQMVIINDSEYAYEKMELPFIINDNERGDIYSARLKVGGITPGEQKKLRINVPAINDYSIVPDAQNIWYSTANDTAS